MKNAPLKISDIISIENMLPKAVLILLSLVLGACSFLPSSGPLSPELSSQSKSAKNTDFPYELIQIDKAVISTIVANEPETFKAAFGNDTWRPKSVIGVGDVVSVVVWEPGDQNGLFSNPATGSRAELGPFQVPQNGKIPVPYIGQISAKGRTIAQLRWAIQSQLQGKAIDPQVVVSISENTSTLVSVNGDAKQPGRHPIALNGSRLSDIIASAGGSSNGATQTQITLIRGQRKVTQQLSSVLSTPNENVYVRAGDQIILDHNPLTITAFGAIRSPGQFPIEPGKVNLIEALGRIGGLDDNRANPTGVFVFRFEQNHVLTDLGIEVTNANAERNPVIYKLDMREGISYFLGQAFNVRDKDVIYVANSTGSELRKFFNILAGISGPSLGVIGAVNR